MEYLDIVDINGCPTGQIVERTKAHKEGIRHRTSHVWIIREKENEIQILLQKRSDNKDSFPGCYDISTAGHIPAGYGYKESAVREAKEELGIDINEEQLIEIGTSYIDTHTQFHGQPFNDVQTTKVFLLYFDQDEFCFQKEEISATLWMNFEKCKKAVKENTIQHCIRNAEMEMITNHLKSA